MLKKITIILFGIIFFTYLQAQNDSLTVNNDSINSELPVGKTKTRQARNGLNNNKEKNMRFSILGGPGYTPDYGVLVGGSTLFTFSTHPEDKNLQRSVLPFAFGLTFAKQIGRAHV